MKRVFKSLVLVMLIAFFNNCKQVSNNKQLNNKLEISNNEPIIIDSVQVVKSLLFLNQNEGNWYYKGKLFNGYSLKYYPNGVLQEKFGFYNGKRQGIAQRWSENGVLRTESHYHQNRIVGVYKSWWENGELSEESYYENGIKQGEEKQWYNNGQLSKLRHLVDGNEQGMQQAWLRNGTLYVNYEAKNGRVFGLLRSNLCYQLENEVVIKN